MYELVPWPDKALYWVVGATGPIGVIASGDIKRMDDASTERYEAYKANLVAMFADVRAALEAEGIT